ncbi:hypothetical protein N7462_005854 [Penicillium macrosclerotiorum]|uniref:uncharacterized protein n=1 Tax=Penicillium macrosclerotiorum TaxID=303699 RepID=UPI002548F7CC|nr:uncharacterized protein N7462_005854 [Penicillium macrosclerotiorum]KAJ5682689.1 hypothetical protein N7462_005854 [Penicillium macrosclerotiorum]
MFLCLLRTSPVEENMGIIIGSFFVPLANLLPFLHYHLNSSEILPLDSMGLPALWSTPAPPCALYPAHPAQLCRYPRPWVAPNNPAHRTDGGLVLHWRSASAPPFTRSLETRPTAKPGLLGRPTRTENGCRYLRRPVCRGMYQLTPPPQSQASN